MKIWTIQSVDVIRIIQEEGEYHADINKSWYIQNNPKIFTGYNFLLTAFNKINNLKENGLIFGFTKLDKNSFVDIKDTSDFASFILEKQTFLLPLLRFLTSKDCKIVELEVEDNFNPIYMDYNDFQLLVPPIIHDEIFTLEDDIRLRKNLNKGCFNKSSFPTGIIQAHLPKITKKQICEIYEFQMY